MAITVEKPSPAQIADMETCPIWEKEVRRFDWQYDEAETCYLLEGQVRVRTEDGAEVAFGAGDLVTFPRGLRCVWDIRRPVRKHYRFG
jgi:uncharacterized cupin superfamily protein